jgi:hypothetical protein
MIGMARTTGSVLRRRATYHPVNARHPEVEHDDVREQTSRLSERILAAGCRRRPPADMNEELREYVEVVLDIIDQEHQRAWAGNSLVGRHW